MEKLLAGIQRREMLQTLGGYAGVGKSVVVGELSRRLPGYGVCAFTGKAADILRRKGLRAGTIHSLIYRPEVDDKGRTRFQLMHPSLVAAQGFLVDEASMVSGDILRDLQSFRRPIIAIGDHGQLPPVGNDAGLMRDPGIKLETIHRNAGPIARFAEHLRMGHRAVDWKETPVAGQPRVYVLPGEEGTVERMARADQIICAFNKTRVDLNKVVRRHLGHEGDIPVVGDRVMCLRNDRLTGVFNGQQGAAVEVRPKGYEMLFAPTYGSKVWLLYHPEGWNKEKPPEYERGGGRFGTELPPIPFDFAYAATAHKCQGDEWAKVMAFEEKCGMWEHSRWCYTVASRSKEAILWILQGGGRRKTPDLFQ